MLYVDLNHAMQLHSMVQHLQFAAVGFGRLQSVL